MTQRFSQACENNKDAILFELRKRFAKSKSVLEIGAGTGQHAVYFAEKLPHIIWQTSDIETNHESILAWQAQTNLSNVRAPISLMIGRDAWPDQTFDAVFTANTSHIMQKSEVQLMMQMVAEHLPTGGVFCQYGPFTQAGKHKGESNLLFDNKLQAEGYGGYRDVSELQAWVADELTLTDIVDMPANNHLLVWIKE